MGNAIHHAGSKATPAQNAIPRTASYKASPIVVAAAGATALFASAVESTAARAGGADDESTSARTVSRLASVRAEMPTEGYAILTSWCAEVCAAG